MMTGDTLTHTHTHTLVYTHTIHCVMRWISIKVWQYDNLKIFPLNSKNDLNQERKPNHLSRPTNHSAIEFNF